MQKIDEYIKRYKEVADIKQLQDMDTYELIGYYMSNFPADPVSRFNYDRIQNNISYTKTMGVDKILTAIKLVESAN